MYDRLTKVLSRTEILDGHAVPQELSDYAVSMRPHAIIKIKLIPRYYASKSLLSFTFAISLHIGRKQTDVSASPLARASSQKLILVQADSGILKWLITRFPSFFLIGSTYRQLFLKREKICLDGRYQSEAYSFVPK